MVDFGDVGDRLSEREDRVAEGLDKVGDAAEKKFEGHGERIDRGIGKAESAFGN